MSAKKLIQPSWRTWGGRPVLGSSVNLRAGGYLSHFLIPPLGAPTSVGFRMPTEVGSGSRAARAERYTRQMWRPSKVLLWLKPGYLGDAVMVTPVLDELAKQLGPEALHVLAGSKVREVLADRAGCAV